MVQSLRFTLCILAWICISVGVGATILRNDETAVKAVREPMDPQGKYLLGWEVNLATGEIVFDIEAETKGYVGFGVSPSGNMIGADIFIGGVNTDGTPYGYDMHGVVAGAPVLDQHFDWQLIEAREDATKTYLKVSRLLNTCDDEDYPISNNTVRLIWSMGITDDIAYHGGNRGTKSQNLVLPDEEDFDPEDYLKWDVQMNIEMPAEDTTYWCNIHKVPNLTQKHHIVSFQPLLENDHALAYTHHFIMYRCQAPAGQDPDDFFGPFVGDPGEHCYAARPRLPVNNCLGKYIYTWSKGGKGMIFPPDLGYPFPLELGVSNYIMMEIHFDNPEKLPGLTFPTGARVLYTDKLREIDAGQLTLAYDVGITLTVPPNVSEFVVAGHCSSGCTQASLPDDGIKVFNSLLHGHLSGRKMKVRQIRGNKELPWPDFDDHYDFDFQQNKPLREFVEIQKGDHLTMECVYNTQWNGNRAVLGGLSTREEMCMAFLWYYPMIPGFEYCGSRYPNANHFASLGITSWTSAKPPEGGLARFTITEPEELAGDYEEVLSTKFPWNATFIAEYEGVHRYASHRLACGDQNANFGQGRFPTGFQIYFPEDQCAANQK